MKTSSEQHRQLAKLYGRMSMSENNEMELIADCQKEVNLMTALGFCSMISSIESLEHLERTHELVTSLRVEMLPGSLQTKQKIESWLEALENEMNLKHSMGYHKTVGLKYLVGSSAAPFCNSKCRRLLVVVDAF